MVVVVVLVVVAVFVALVVYGDRVQKREKAERAEADLVVDERMIDRIMSELEVRMAERLGPELEPLLANAVAQALHGADTEPLPAQPRSSGAMPALRWDETAQAWTDGVKWYRAA